MGRDRSRDGLKSAADPRPFCVTTDVSRRAGVSGLVTSALHPSDSEFRRDAFALRTRGIRIWQFQLSVTSCNVPPVTRIGCQFLFSTSDNSIRYKSPEL